MASASCRSRPGEVIRCAPKPVTKSSKKPVRYEREGSTRSLDAGRDQGNVGFAVETPLDPPQPLRGMLYARDGDALLPYSTSAG